ncbi:uncharacterized protein M6B38_172020 [Iris pallida]|uniref:Uncharacterized protein n=1 Tax=Iris pallida TaxID=29817 RepID=A0AAX6ETA9_IRIPA|nr:uncharacterized protein M6B38_172020 [Iris pallida]
MMRASIVSGYTGRDAQKFSASLFQESAMMIEEIFRIRRRGRKKNKEGNTTEEEEEQEDDRLTIYSIEDLGFGKTDVGGTVLCPFDCDCCL